MTTRNSSPAENPVIALVCLGGAVLLWGTSFIATKAALNAGFSPMTVVWLRMTIATVVLAPFWFRIARPEYRAGDWRWIGLVCFLQAGIYYLCENYAIGLTTSSQAGVISAIVPLFVAAGAWLFLREDIGGRTMGAIAISIAGVVLLSLGSKASATAPDPVLGNALEMGAMVSAACSMIATKHLVDRYSPWMLTGFQCLFGSVFFLPGALLSNPTTWGRVGTSGWVAVAFLGAGVSLAAFGLYAMAMQRMPASQASLAVNAVPLVALVAGWLAFGESLGWLQVAGCAAIAGGVALGQVGGGQRPEVETALTEY